MVEYTCSQRIFFILHCIKLNTLFTITLQIQKLTLSDGCQLTPAKNGYTNEKP